jgi:hypothetical protein
MDYREKENDRAIRNEDPEAHCFVMDPKRDR